MIAVGVFVVGLVSSIIVGALLILVLYLFVRLSRTTKRYLEGRVASRWLTWAGGAIAVAGLVQLIWTQIAFDEPFDNALFRWQEAGAALVVVALGLLVVIAAQLLEVLRSQRPLG